MKRALLTGITGQDGLYLSELLLGKGYEVHAILRGQHNPKREMVEQSVPGVHLHLGDLTDLGSLVRILALVEPEEFYNLGAISYVAYSWDNPMVTSNVTGLGALNALEAVRLHCGRDPRRVRFYQASSSEMFDGTHGSPQTESTLLHPRSPYGVAKVFAHHMTINYRESYGMHASSGILFNHESPRRGAEFVTRKVSRAVARIALGLQDTLAMGTLTARRDWGFAGDYVDAMWRMVQQDEPGDYVVATGRSHSVADLLDVAFTRVGIRDWSGHVVQDQRFLRPAEIDELVGDAGLAKERLGWEPTVGFVDLVNMMVDHDLADQERLHRVGVAPATAALAL